MILDFLLRTSTAQAVTATAVSTDTIDLSQVERQRGEPIHFVWHVDTAATAAGAATVTFQIVTDTVANLASPTVVAATAAIGKATLVAGYTIALPLPPNISLERYLGCQYTVATGPLTAGAFTCDMVLDTQNDYSFPAAITYSS
jgi:hypothetical protein